MSTRTMLSLRDVHCAVAAARLREPSGTGETLSVEGPERNVLVRRVSPPTEKVSPWSDSTTWRPSADKASAASGRHLDIIAILTAGWQQQTVHPYYRLSNRDL